MPRPFTVLVTGCGPFPDGHGSRYTNASHLLTQILPSNTVSSPSSIPITILNPTSAPGAYLRTEYAYARRYLAELHSTPLYDGREVDLYLHLGQAAGWGFVSVERGAWRQGRKGWYDSSPDDEGKVRPRDNPWEGMPEWLPTGFGVDDVVARVAAVADDPAGLEVRPHDEPGGYLCGFICYESLVNRLSRGRDGRCLFVHVPGETGEEALEKARDAVLNIMRAVAEQVVEREGEGAASGGVAQKGQKEREPLEDGWVMC